MLFSWFYKGFKPLRRYLVKHLTGVDLEGLDLEVVDKEMAEDEVAQVAQVAQAAATTPKGDVPEPTNA